MGSLSTLFAKQRGISTVALDTMVFIYHVEDRMPYSKFTTELFDGGERGEVQLCTSVLTITEVLTGYRRLKDANAEQSFLQMLNQFYSFLKVWPVDFFVADRAASLRAAYGIRTPDAVHLATAIAVGAELYITNDRKLKPVKEVSVVLLTELVRKAGAK